MKCVCSYVLEYILEYNWGVEALCAYICRVYTNHSARLNLHRILIKVSFRSQNAPAMVGMVCIYHSEYMQQFVGETLLSKVYSTKK